MYCIRPLLGYASNVWGRCTVRDSDRLEKVLVTDADYLYLLLDTLSILKQVGNTFRVLGRQN